MKAVGHWGGDGGRVSLEAVSCSGLFLDPILLHSIKKLMALLGHISTVVMFSSRTVDQLTVD